MADGSDGKTVHVVYLEPVPPDVEAIIRKCLPEGFNLRVRRSEEAPGEVIREAEFILVATTPLPAKIIAQAKLLKLIQHQGVGHDKTDIAAAADLGVPVALTPEGTSTPVAEHVFLLILSLYRRLLTANRSLREGKWLQWELRGHSYDLLNKHLGIVGLGRIGREVAQRARGFGCRISYYDVQRAPKNVEADFGLHYSHFHDLLSESDIITLHVPRTEATQGIIGAAQLNRMRSNALLINTARGGLVDEAALYQALRDGQIAGAGLDVFSTEPPVPDHPLLQLENVVATPHISAGTADALTAKMRAAFGNMLRVVRGEPPHHQVAVIE